MSKIITTTSANQTIQLGKKIAKTLKVGQVIGLVGELGAGKTQFVKGLAKGLGLKNNITSPTFVLLRNYESVKLVHIDCYRLNNSDELLELGFEELIKDNIIVIEWADKIRSILPKDTHWVKFKVGKKENQRLINL